MDQFQIDYSQNVFQYQLYSSESQVAIDQDTRYFTSTRGIYPKHNEL